MRSLLLAVFLLPFLAGAQINRSAKELAREKIQEYVANKLFKNKQYTPLSYGEINQVQDKRSAIVWVLAHKFEITEGGQSSFERTTASRHPYKFLFYLDEKMKVLKAETYYSN